MVGFKQWPRTDGTTRIGHFVFSSFNSYFESNQLHSVLGFFSTAGGHRVRTGAPFRAISGDDTAHSCWMEQVPETLRAVWDTAFWYVWIPSGELTFCHGKSPFLMGKSWNIHYKWPFSIAMLVHQRVLNHWAAECFFVCDGVNRAHREFKP